MWNSSLESFYDDHNRMTGQLDSNSNKDSLNLALRTESNLELQIDSDGQEDESGTIWERIMREYERERQEIETYRNAKHPSEPCSIPKGSTVEYMDENVFSILFPTLVDVLIQAIEKDALNGPRNTFNGLDMIAQVMWNNNPNYPERKEENLSIHDMLWVKQFLEDNPRPHFPKSWIYTKEIAAKIIQSYMRGYWVRRQEHVQELRRFWKILKREKDGEPIDDILEESRQEPRVSNLDTSQKHTSE